jgi:hypothetical protein
MRSLLCLVACALPLASAATWGPDSQVFGSHMVLASNDPWSGGVTPARVWGTGVAGEAIAVGGLPAGAVVEPSNPWTVSADGTWNITVSAPASMTPYNLLFKGSASTVLLEDVLFGHTFLCSGQVRCDWHLLVAKSGMMSPSFAHTVPNSCRALCAAARAIKCSWLHKQSNMDMSVGCTFTVNEVGWCSQSPSPPPPHTHTNSGEGAPHLSPFFEIVAPPAHASFLLPRLL